MRTRSSPASELFAPIQRAIALPFAFDRIPHNRPEKAARRALALVPQWREAANAPPHLQHDRERYREENAKIAAVDTAEAGGPPSTTLVCTIPTEGAPSLRLLQGWVPMLRVLFDFVVDT